MPAHVLVPGSLAHGGRRLAGQGVIQGEGDTIRLINRGASRSHYTNAQLDDYRALARNRFPWCAPLTLTVRACFSHDQNRLVGTAGFGFWNDPFAVGGRLPTLPRVAWFFFASPPSDMALAAGVSGSGWKAATMDAWSLPFLLLAPTAPLAIFLMRSSALYARLWPVAQRAMAVCEAPLPVSMGDWHTYTLRWNPEEVSFSVDGQTILTCNKSPRGRLGLVIWIDNQYMVVTPQGSVRHGLLPFAHHQFLELAEVRVETDPACSGNAVQ